ncbi:MAG: CDP-glucose 4,6-dehydratase, partial [Verrucomicrobia bacterium]|nr:CDP-glucose 4,6-dehydratase [Verrucomicrobiota bacterium]
ASGYNFGPALASNRTVADLVQELLKHWPGRWEDNSDPKAVHEAKLLNLATDKAHHFLDWSPVWPFGRTIAETAGWYLRNHRDGKAGAADTAAQIAAYTADARALKLSWSL